MQASFGGAVYASGSSIVFGRILFNPEQEICQHCRRPLQVGDRFAVLSIVGLDDIAVHLECACIWREKMGVGVRASAGGRP